RGSRFRTGRRATASGRGLDIAGEHHPRSCWPARDRLGCHAPLCQRFMHPVRFRQGGSKRQATIREVPACPAIDRSVLVNRRCRKIIEPAPLDAIIDGHLARSIRSRARYQVEIRSPKVGVAGMVKTAMGVKEVPVVGSTSIVVVGGPPARAEFIVDYILGIS